MTRKPRLADIARAAGVSQGTASNVFNRPGLVRQEVRERVEAAAAKLGYAGPDPKGRLLRAGKVNAIGLVVSERLSVFTRDPFDRLFMAGIADVCDERGAGLALVSAHDNDAAAWNVQSALVDGFILHCLEDGARLLDLAKRRNLPFVAVDVDAGPGATSVCIDDRKGARLAAEHVARLGHRAVAVVALELVGDGRFGFADAERRRSARYAVTRDRLAGYGDGLAAAGIAIGDVPVYEAANFREDARIATDAILDRFPDTTAILAMSDQVAFGVIEAARRRGLSVPRDLSVVGFDDIGEAAMFDPPLTTVAQPIVEKGRRAAELIFLGGPPRTELLDVDLVVRGSTAPPKR